MSQEVLVDKDVFSRRVKLLRDAFKGESELDSQKVLAGVDGVLVVFDQPNDDNPYSKTVAMHNWLLGYEFPRTIMYVGRDIICFLSSPKKTAILEDLKTTGMRVELFTRTKEPEHNSQQYDALLALIKASGTRVGYFSKDKPVGVMYDEWSAVYGKQAFEQVDVALGVGAVMAVKDQDELDCISQASRATSYVLAKPFVNEMSTIIDQGKKVTHSRLSENVENKLDNAGLFASKSFKAEPGFDSSLLEWCYTPIVQSGGVYDLKPSAASDDKQLHPGVIVAELGLRYKSYCSNIGRTYLIDPNSQQERTYEFLLSLQRKVMEVMKDGAVISDVYNAALGQIRAKRPDLEPHFVKNMGASIGIEFRESSLSLSAKNTRQLKTGMTFSLSIGFQDLASHKQQDAKSKTYSLLLIDTVQVGTNGASLLTDSPKQLGDVSFWLNEDEDDSVKDEESDDGGIGSSRRSNGRPERSAAVSLATGKRTRGADRKVDESAENRRREHQKELSQRIQEEGLKRFENGNGESTNADGPVFKKFESYRRDTQLPSAIAELQVLVDQKAQTVILPIEGRPVPFHISTLKNLSKNDEGEYMFLRFNFMSPGQAFMRKDDQPFDDPNATFIRSITYRSSDVMRFSQLFGAIQEMKKLATKREAERKEMADIVEQENLAEIRNRRPVTLTDVYVRPGLDGKRVPGQLEIHQNGIRYQSPLRADHRIDVLFSNMRHLFYQPCDHELIVVIHIHLKTPILVGKRKTYDVQVYREASDAQADETGNKRRKFRRGDEDELEQEQEERRRRALLNKEFRAFAEKIADSSEGKVDVDIPFRELGFSGVPFRGNVLLQPTTECLVQLIDPPFTVITLSEVEIAHLERVQFGLKNFDLVFVLKDYKKAPIHVNTIPVQQLDSVKDWLDSVDIPYTEGPLNLNWTTIMKTVNDDPAQFFRDGGWSFLGSDSEGESDESEDAESEFEASGSDFDEDESSEEDGSEFDEDASDSGSGDFDEDEESGEDWDELERKAAKADARRGAADDERPRKRRK